MNDILSSFIDENGRLTAFPSKRKKKLHALIFLSQKFQPGVVYSEKEVNELLNEWHTFGDPATLRAILDGSGLPPFRIFLTDDSEVFREYFSF